MFSQYHEFFGDLYEELYGAVDPIAEQIRALGVYAPISLTELTRYATFQEDMSKPTSIRDMIGNLQVSNVETIASLNKAFELAEQSNNQGLMDFLAGRLDIHAKHGWMIRSSLKGIS